MPRFGEIVVIKRNGSDGTHFPLTTTTCLFGRKTECDIRIQLPMVSKEHCKIEVNENKEVILSNLSTVNPTQLNGTLIDEPIQLKHGDVITIIDRSFRFEFPFLSTPRKTRQSTSFTVEPRQQVTEVETPHRKKRQQSSSSEVSDETLHKIQNDGEKLQNIEDLSRTSAKQSSSNRALLRRSKSAHTVSPFSELYEIVKYQIDTNPKQHDESKRKSVTKQTNTPKKGSCQNILQDNTASQTPLSSRCRSGRLNHLDTKEAASIVGESHVSIKHQEINLESNYIPEVVNVSVKTSSRGRRSSASEKDEGKEKHDMPVKENVKSNEESISGKDEEIKLSKAELGSKSKKSGQCVAETLKSLVSTPKSKRKSLRGNNSSIEDEVEMGNSSVVLQSEHTTPKLQVSSNNNGKETPTVRYEDFISEYKSTVEEKEGAQQKRKSKHLSPMKSLNAQQLLNEIQEDLSSAGTTKVKSSSQTYKVASLPLPNKKSPKQSSTSSPFVKDLQTTPILEPLIAEKELTESENSSQKVTSRTRKGRSIAGQTSNLTSVFHQYEHSPKANVRLSSSCKVSEANLLSNLAIPEKPLTTEQSPTTLNLSPGIRSRKTRTSEHMAKIHSEIEDINQQLMHESSQTSLVLEDAVTPLEPLRLFSGKAQKSPQKRKSQEFDLLSQPPTKRKRVSFGGHLSPELFDKRLPPNSPLKKGATPARLSLPFFSSSPLAARRKSFGHRHSVIQDRSKQQPMQTSEGSVVSYLSETMPSSVGRSAAKTFSTPSSVMNPAGLSSAETTATTEALARLPAASASVTSSFTGISDVKSSITSSIRTVPFSRSPASFLSKTSSTTSPARKVPVRSSRNISHTVKSSPSSTTKSTAVSPPRNINGSCASISPVRSSAAVPRRSSPPIKALASRSSSMPPATRSRRISPTDQTPTSQFSALKSPDSSLGMLPINRTPSSQSLTLKIPRRSPAIRSPGTSQTGKTQSARSHVLRSSGKSHGTSSSKSSVTRPSCTSPNEQMLSSSEWPFTTSAAGQTPPSKLPGQSPATRFHNISPAGQRPSSKSPSAKSHERSLGTSPTGQALSSQCLALKLRGRSPITRSSDISLTGKTAFSRSSILKMSTSPYKSPAGQTLSWSLALKPTGTFTGMLPTGRLPSARSPSMSPTGRPPSARSPGMSPTGCPPYTRSPGMSPAGRPPSAMSPAGRPPSAMSPAGRPPSAMSPAGRPPSAMSPAGRPLSAKSPALRSSGRSRSTSSSESSLAMSSGTSTEQMLSSPEWAFSTPATVEMLFSRSLVRSPISRLHSRSPAGRRSSSRSPAVRSPARSPASRLHSRSPAGRRTLSRSPAEKSPGRPPATRPHSLSPAGRRTSSRTPAAKLSGRPAATRPHSLSPAGRRTSSRTPAAKLPGRPPAARPHSLSPAGRKTSSRPPAAKSPGRPPAAKSPGRPPATRPHSLSPAGRRTSSRNPAAKSPGRPPSLSPAGRRTSSRTPAAKSPGRPPSLSPAGRRTSSRTPAAKSPGRPPSLSPAGRRTSSRTPGAKSPGRPPAARPHSLSPAGRRTSSRPPAAKSPGRPPAAKSPGRPPAAKSPGRPPAAKSPGRPPAAKSPGRPPAAKSPGRPPAAKSPGRPPAAKSPGRPPAAKSPGRPPAAKSPGRPPAAKSPGRPPAAKSPGRPPAAKSPGISPVGQMPTSRSPAAKSPGRSPDTRSSAAKSPGRSPDTRSSAAKSPGRSPDTRSSAAKSSGISPVGQMPSSRSSAAKSPGRSPDTRSSAAKSPGRSPDTRSSAAKSPGISPVGQMPSSRSPAAKSSGRSPDTRSPAAKSPGRSPDTRSPAAKSPGISPVGQMPSSRSPAAKSPGRSPDTRSPAAKSPGRSPDTRPPAAKSPGRSPETRLPAAKSPGISPVGQMPSSRSPAAKSSGRSPDTRSPAAKSPGRSPDTRSPAAQSPGRSPDTRSPAAKSPGRSPATRSRISAAGQRPFSSSPCISPACQRPSSRSPATESPRSSPAAKLPGRSCAANSYIILPVGQTSSMSPVVKLPGRSPALKSPGRSPAKRSRISAAGQRPFSSSPAAKSVGKSPATRLHSISPAARSTFSWSPAAKTHRISSAGRMPSSRSPAMKSSGRPSPVKSHSTSPAGRTLSSRFSVSRSHSTASADRSLYSRSPGSPQTARSHNTSPASLRLSRMSPTTRFPGTSPSSSSSLMKSSPGRSQFSSPAIGRSPIVTSPVATRLSAARLISTSATIRSSGRPRILKSTTTLSATAGSADGPSYSWSTMSSPTSKSPSRAPISARAFHSNLDEIINPSSIERVSSSSERLMTSPQKLYSNFTTVSSPHTPYKKGRFSVSRISTPPSSSQDAPEEICAKGHFTGLKPNEDFNTVQSINMSISSMSKQQSRRKSMRSTANRTPLYRRSRGNVLEDVRSRRKSANVANLLVAKSWADVVKFGVARPQVKQEKKDGLRVKLSKKKLKSKQTPARKIKDHFSTGHADSPATIVIGQAHSRPINVTGCAPLIVTNYALKQNMNLNESFTGLAEMFQTPVNPVNVKQRRSSRLSGVLKSDATPNASLVEVLEILTPEESGEMFVSPLSTPGTTKRQQYNQDAVSRLLRVQRAPSSSFAGIKRLMRTPKGRTAVLENITVISKKSPVVQEEVDLKGIKLMKMKEISMEDFIDVKRLIKTSKEKVEPETALSGIKRLLKTPRQKSKPVTDAVALKRLLKTPRQKKQIEPDISVLMHTSRTRKQKKKLVEDMTGISRIMKTPKQKGQPVEDMIGISRIMKTPKQKGQPVEDMVGIRRIMKTPKQKGQPLEDMVGIRRIMKTPKQKGQPVEDMVGISRIMKTPKQKGQPVDDMIGIKALMKSPQQICDAVENIGGGSRLLRMRRIRKNPVEDLVGVKVMFGSSKESKVMSTEDLTFVQENSASLKFPCSRSAVESKVTVSKTEEKRTITGKELKETEIEHSHMSQKSQNVMKMEGSKGKTNGRSVRKRWLTEAPEYISDTKTKPRKKPQKKLNQKLSKSDTEKLPVENAQATYIQATQEATLSVEETSKSSLPKRRGRSQKEKIEEYSALADVKALEKNEQTKESVNETQKNDVCSESSATENIRKGRRKKNAEENPISEIPNQTKLHKMDGILEVEETAKRATRARRNVPQSLREQDLRNSVSQISKQKQENKSPSMKKNLLICEELTLNNSLLKQTDVTETVQVKKSVQWHPLLIDLKASVRKRKLNQESTGDEKEISSTMRSLREKSKLDLQQCLVPAKRPRREKTGNNHVSTGTDFAVERKQTRRQTAKNAQKTTQQVIANSTNEIVTETKKLRNAKQKAFESTATVQSQRLQKMTRKAQQHRETKSETIISGQEKTKELVVDIKNVGKSLEDQTDGMPASKVSRATKKIDKVSSIKAASSVNGAKADRGKNQITDQRSPLEGSLSEPVLSLDSNPPVNKQSESKRNANPRFRQCMTAIKNIPGTNTDLGENLYTIKKKAAKIETTTVLTRRKASVTKTLEEMKNMSNLQPSNRRTRRQISGDTVIQETMANITKEPSNNVRRTRKRKLTNEEVVIEIQQENQLESISESVAKSGHRAKSLKKQAKQKEADFGCYAQDEVSATGGRQSGKINDIPSLKEMKATACSVGGGKVDKSEKENPKRGRSQAIEKNPPLSLSRRGRKKKATSEVRTDSPVKSISSRRKPSLADRTQAKTLKMETDHSTIQQKKKRRKER
ncbi:proliferation marker protein Ki-67 isoform X2 [Rhinatrema bivittatum]|uniref:proliferation marker protein Ki-67 isoform X2 n=1 Tax=Rhinatrema bivittatum TaxID=194408 RepID=UPI0011281C1D|nr:proliferation marker protein Ki-67 isoform X2 [Rhinatrema bivittatum]